LDYNNLWDTLQKTLDDMNIEDVSSLQKAGTKCRELIQNVKIPEDLEKEIIDNFYELKKEYGDDLSVAVRSSATAEDSPEASFAGQNETYLNIQNEEALLDSYKRCLASNFTDRSIHYKYDNGFDYLKVYLSVVVMKMVRSDLASAGVMFSLDTETGFRDVVFINAAWGLGENVVLGAVEPDSFYIHKPTFKKGYKAVLKRKLGNKNVKMIFTKEAYVSNMAYEYTKNVSTTEEERNKFAITDNDAVTLGDYAIKIEEHYSKKFGFHKPMDMEWAKDGITGEIYIVQARPETVQSQKKDNVLEIYSLKEKSRVILRGRAVGTKIGAGKVHVIHDISEMDSFKEGEVLVSDITTPDWEPIMKKASALITNKGGRTCHAAIVSRELGLPAVVGTGNATEILKDGDEVTVSCAEGETGFIYEGILNYEITKTDLSNLPKTKTDIMMNLGNPTKPFH
jgi:pyruvate,water dikinase